MDLKGKIYQFLYDAMIESLTPGDLNRLLIVAMETNPAAITIAPTMDQRVQAVIQWVDQRDREIEFIDALRIARPKNKKLFVVAQKFGLVSTDKSRTELEKIIQESHGFLDVNLWRDKLSKLETQVCRIEMGGNPLGTGFLVGSSTVMTNYHVVERAIKDASKVKDVQVRFDFKLVQIGNRTERRMGKAYGLNESDWLIDKSPYSVIDTQKLEDKVGDPQPDELDFAILQLAEPVADLPAIGVAAENLPAIEMAAENKMKPEPRGFVAIGDFSADSPIQDNPGDTLFILQHPQGQPLKLDFNAIQAKNDNATRIRYVTNTQKGSSGSPCFDRDWRLTALHHSGDPSFSPVFNEGIPMGAIVALLKANNTYSKAIGKQEEKI